MGPAQRETAATIRSPYDEAVRYGVKFVADDAPDRPRPIQSTRAPRTVVAMVIGLLPLVGRSTEPEWPQSLYLPGISDHRPVNAGADVVVAWILPESK
jgi:hypothetical protein